jgi:hypothetical protein
MLISDEEKALLEAKFLRVLKIFKENPSTHFLDLARQLNFDKSQDFEGTNLSNVNLSIDPSSQNHLEDDWISVNLKSAELICSNLSGLNLAKANFENADLTSADLSGTWLQGANLTGANLTEAKLIGADLTGANLSYTILMGADFSESILSGVDISYALVSRDDLEKNGKHFNALELRLNGGVLFLENDRNVTELDNNAFYQKISEILAKMETTQNFSIDIGDTDYFIGGRATKLERTGTSEIDITSVMNINGVDTNESESYDSGQQDVKF